MNASVPLRVESGLPEGGHERPRVANVGLIGAVLAHFPFLFGERREEAYAAGLLGLWQEAGRFDASRGRGGASKPTRSALALQSLWRMRQDVSCVLDVLLSLSLAFLSLPLLPSVRRISANSCFRCSPSSFSAFCQSSL